MMKPAATAGQLRFRIRFDRQMLTEDPYGGTTSAWTEQFTRWADIRPIRGGESVQAQRLQGTQPVLIIVRCDNQTKLIDSSWRAVQMINGEPVSYYALKTAQDMEMGNAFVTMLAVSGEADGGDGA